MNGTNTMNPQMTINDLRSYLEKCPVGEEKDILRKLLDYFEEVKDKADAIKQYDRAIGGIGLD